MGRGKRIIPDKMPGKLHTIRKKAGFTLEETAKALEGKLKDLDYAEIRLYSGNIHEYERGTREPMLPVLMAYSRIAGVSVDYLVDNESE